MKIASIIAASIFSLAAAHAGAVEILKTEPGKGKLKDGAIVYVDDGTCGKGKVKRVLGGNQPKGIGRTTTCIATPK